MSESNGVLSLTHWSLFNYLEGGPSILSFSCRYAHFQPILSDTIQWMTMTRGQYENRSTSSWCKSRLNHYKDARIFQIDWRWSEARAKEYLRAILLFIGVVHKQTKWVFTLHLCLSKRDEFDHHVQQSWHVVLFWAFVVIVSLHPEIYIKSPSILLQRIAVLWSSVYRFIRAYVFLWIIWRSYLEGNLVWPI